MTRWWRPALLYGIALAAAAFALEWLDLQHGLKRWSTSAYVIAVAVGFAALGLWAGNRLTAKPKPPFERNLAVIATLGISAREVEVLELLSEGYANKVIARRLGISPNTVKTHVTSLFQKLEASNRTEAVGKARLHRILP
jgi:DNA-binding NarL/FixJ family response regulator